MTANLPTATKSKTPWLASSLNAKLTDLLLSGDNPVVGPVTAKALASFAAEPEPVLPERSEIEVMVGKLATSLADKRVSDAEALERLENYLLVLRDVPIADLRASYAELLRTCTFMPKPAEVRTAALRKGALRRHSKSRAAWLVKLHEREWKPPVPMADPADVKALLSDAA